MGKVYRPVRRAICVGHDTYMQVTPKALHQNGRMKYAYTEWYESRKNVRMDIWLNPKYPLQWLFMQGKPE